MCAHKDVALNQQISKPDRLDEALQADSQTAIPG